MKENYLREARRYKFKHGVKHAGKRKALEKYYITKNGRWAKKRPGWSVEKVYGQTVEEIAEEFFEQLPQNFSMARVNMGAGVYWQTKAKKRSFRKYWMKLRYKEKEVADLAARKARIDRHMAGIYTDSDGNIPEQTEEEEDEAVVKEMQEERRRREEEEARKKQEEKEAAFKAELKGTVFEDDDIGDLDTMEDEDEDEDEGED